MSVSHTTAPAGTEQPRPPAQQRRNRGPAGDRIFTVVAQIILGIWSLLVILPLLWTFYSSLKNSRETPALQPPREAERRQLRERRGSS